MPQFVEVIIGFNFVGSSLEILCTYNKQNQNFGCGCKMCYFTCAKGFSFRGVVVGWPRWLNMGRPCV